MLVLMGSMAPVLEYFGWRYSSSVGVVKVMRMVERQEAGSRHLRCSGCSPLRSFEKGEQKGGRELEDTFLPGAAARLIDVCETRAVAGFAEVSGVWDLLFV